jgi:hypothetical protein
MIETRNTPIVEPDGFATAPLAGSTELLSNVVTIPRNANAAWVEGAALGTFGYRLDGAEGETDVLTANRVYLSNRQQLNDCVVCSTGGAATIVVQFVTGRTGA